MSLSNKTISSKSTSEEDSGKRRKRFPAALSHTLKLNLELTDVDTRQGNDYVGFEEVEIPVSGINKQQNFYCDIPHQSSL